MCSPSRSPLPPPSPPGPSGSSQCARPEFKFVLFYLFIASLIHASVQFLQDLKKKNMCFLSVINFRASLAIMTPNISSVPFALSSPSGIPITHTLYLLKLSHSSQMFCFFFLTIFSLVFEFEEFPLIHHGPDRFLHQSYILMKP